MAKFILRFRGAGAKPAADVTRVKACAGVTVLDDSMPRMLLVEGAKSKVAHLAGSLEGWVISEERALQLPSPRPKVRSKAGAKRAA
ncbi:MAG: hypothetical protein IT515_10235 [Burkholderiales bacterium]|nr:hypothetical protein [Burkholderiales bacterium]